METFQNGFDGRCVGFHELQGEGDEFKIARRRIIKYQILQHPRLVVQQLLVRRQVLAGGGVQAGGVNANQNYIFSSKKFNSLCGQRHK